MRRSLYSTVAFVGLLLMLAGAATTYIALGQDGDAPAATEVAEVTEEVIPTEVPVQEAAPAQPQAAAPVEVIVPTLPPPTPVPPTPIPPTPIPPTPEPSPTVEVIVPVESQPQEVQAPLQIVQETLVPTEGILPVESQAQDVQAPADHSVAGDVIPPVESVNLEVMQEAQAAVVEEAEPVIEAVEATAEVSLPAVDEVLPVEPQIEVTEVVTDAPEAQAEVTEAVEVIVTEAIPPVEAAEPVHAVDGADRGGALGAGGAQSVGSDAPESVFTATPEVPVLVEPHATEVPTTEVIEPELTESGPIESPDSSEPEATEAVGAEVMPTAESTEPVVAVGAVISGQVGMVYGKLAGIQLNLTTPAGDMVTQTADEQGDFLFDALQPGDYRMEASAPGFISRRIQFTLAADEQLELPQAVLRPGDLNQDNRVDLSDVVLVAANFDGPAVILDADLNGDSWIDISDLAIVGSQFGDAGPLPWN